MKSNREWFTLLTDKEQEEFKRNCDDFDIDFEECLDMDSEDFEDFIAGAFVWSRTTQGCNYWKQIAESNREIKQ